MSFKQTQNLTIKLFILEGGLRSNGGRGLHWQYTTTTTGGSGHMMTSHVDVTRGLQTVSNSFPEHTSRTFFLEDLSLAAQPTEAPLSSTVCSGTI